MKYFFHSQVINLIDCKYYNQIKLIQIEKSISRKKLQKMNETLLIFFGSKANYLFVYFQK